MARFVDLDDDDDAGPIVVGPGPGHEAQQAHSYAGQTPAPMPMPGQLHHNHFHDNDPQQLQLRQQQQEHQHQLLLKKLQLLSANGRNGHWPDGYYTPEPKATMDTATFRSSATDALGCYPYVFTLSPIPSYPICSNSSYLSILNGPVSQECLVMGPMGRTPTAHLPDVEIIPC